LKEHRRVTELLIKNVLAFDSAAKPSEVYFS